MREAGATSGKWHLRRQPDIHRPPDPTIRCFPEGQQDILDGLRILLPRRWGWRRICSAASEGNPLVVVALGTGQIKEGQPGEDGRLQSQSQAQTAAMIEGPPSHGLSGPDGAAAICLRRCVR